MSASIVGIVRRVLPTPLLDAGRRMVGGLRRARAKRRTRRSSQQQQSAAEVFSQVYLENVWGGPAGEFYSGGGSKDSFTDAYRDLVNSMLAEESGRRVTIVDLGCGDFRVGRRLVSPGIDYVGVDVVPSLIEHNRRTFGQESVTFVCLDIVEDDLPEGDLCLIRQVFQHLSNDEIARVLSKLRSYPRTLVTEHYFADDSRIVPNLDKPHGPDTRLVQGSGVYLDRPPFSVRGVEPMLTVPFDRWTELRTFKLEFPAGD
jgi:hypothetical protein